MCLNIFGLFISPHWTIPDGYRICVSSGESNPLELQMCLIEGEDHDIGSVFFLEMWGPWKDLIAGG
jgi:hypothetical protein